MRKARADLGAAGCGFPLASTKIIRVLLGAAWSAETVRVATAPTSDAPKFALALPRFFVAERLRPALGTRMHGLLRRAEAFSTSEWTTSCAIASRTRHSPGGAFSTSVSIDRCTSDFRSRLGRIHNLLEASADHDHAEQRTQTPA